MEGFFNRDAPGNAPPAPCIWRVVDCMAAARRDWQYGLVPEQGRDPNGNAAVQMAGVLEL